MLWTSGMTLAYPEASHCLMGALGEWAFPTGGVGPLASAHACLGLCGASSQLSLLTCHCTSYIVGTWFTKRGGSSKWHPPPHCRHQALTHLTH